MFMRMGLLAPGIPSVCAAQHAPHTYSHFANMGSGSECIHEVVALVAVR